jgi:energy-converting hydrogenase Eha subunit C
MIAAIALIIIGSLLLLSNLGYLKIANVAELVHTWWPLILIAVGISMFLNRWRRNR